MQLAANRNKGQPVEWLYSTSQDLVLEHRLSEWNKEILCLPCCARYLSSTALAVPLINTSTFFPQDAIHDVVQQHSVDRHESLDVSSG